MDKDLHPIDSFGIQKVSLSGIRVERLEDRLKPGVPFPHKHDFFQYLIVTSGSGEHQIDFKKHKVSPGQIYMMNPGQIHSWTMKKGIRGILVEFSYQSITHKDSSKLINEVSFMGDLLNVKDKQDFEEVVILCELMLRESELKRELHDLCLQNYVATFLLLLIRLQEKQLTTAKNLTTVEKFRDLLEKNFKSEHAVEFYARKLSTTPRALTMQFSRSIGRPPRELIQERILLEAKRFLAFSELSIAEIGYELGFDDANYFTRFFRIHEKKSPAKFRRDTVHSDHE